MAATARDSVGISELHERDIKYSPLQDLLLAQKFDYASLDSRRNHPKSGLTSESDRVIIALSSLFKAVVQPACARYLKNMSAVNVLVAMCGRANAEDIRDGDGSTCTDEIGKIGPKHVNRVDKHWSWE